MATARLAALAAPYRSLTTTSLEEVVRQYLETLAVLIECHDTAALDSFLDTLDEYWLARGFEIKHIVDGMFTVSDIFREMLDADHDHPVIETVDHWSRVAVSDFSQRAASVLSEQANQELEQHRRTEERLFSLQRVSAAVVSELDLDRTLDLVVSEAMRLMQASAAAIRLIDDDGETLRIIAQVGAVESLLYERAMPVYGSLSGWCFRNRLPVISNDVLADPRLSEEIRDSSVLQALMIVPLMVRDVAIGVLLVSDRESGSFSEEDRQLLQLFADQAAAAIEHGRLYRQAQSQIAELAALRRISSVVSSSLEIDDVFGSLYEEVRGVMPADAFVIGMLREDGLYDLDFLADGDARYAPRHGMQFSPIFQQVAQDRKPRIIADNEAPDAPQLAMIDHDSHNQVRSLVIVPLLHDDELVGLLSAQSYTPHAYKESDAQLLMTIANHAVVAIDHAKLFRQAQSLAIAEERNRLAREIHDTLAQGLIGLTLYLERLDLMFADDPQASDIIDRALRLTRSNLEEARRSVRDLRAAPLEGRTLLEAISQLIGEFEPESSFTVQIHTTGMLPNLAARVEAALFRMIQEALTNCHKHAQCSEVELHITIEDDRLRVSVIDNGRGFDLDMALSESGRFGLSSMRERIAQIGGDFSVESSPDRGTRVHACIPLSHATTLEPNWTASP